MRRRDFIKGFSAAATMSPLAARAQSGKLPTIGFLGGAAPSAWSSMDRRICAATVRTGLD